MIATPASGLHDLPPVESVPCAGGMPLPIATLAVETLEEIFFHFCSDRTDELDSFRALALSHVCHFWREVALNSGRLWTMIDLQYPELAQHYLRYSKRTPLRVFWTEESMHRHVDPTAVCCLRPHAMRIQRIEILQRLENLNRFFGQMRREYSVLEVLVVAAHVTLMNGKLYLGVLAPRLRVLVITNTTLLAPDVIEVLRASPCLEHLALGAVAVHLSMETVHTRDIVELSHIRECTFTNSSGIHLLLNSLKLPASAGLFLKKSEPTDLSSALNAATKSRLSQFQHAVMDVGFGQIYTRASDTQVPPTASFEFQTLFVPKLTEALTTYGAIFGWSSIAILQLNKDGSLSRHLSASLTQAWAPLLEQLPSLTTLRVIDMPLDALTTCICPPDCDVTLRSIPCPQLCSLHLVNYDFTFTRTHSDSDVIHNSNVRCLIDFVRVRYQAEMPLKEVRLEGGSGQEEVKQLLEEMVRGFRVNDTVVG